MLNSLPNLDCPISCLQPRLCGECRSRFGGACRHPQFSETCGVCSHRSPRAKRAQNGAARFESDEHTLCAALASGALQSDWPAGLTIEGANVDEATGP